MALHNEMGRENEGFLDAVIIYKGNLSDPNFPLKLSSTIKNLKILCQKCDSLVIKKVEPWNSVRVTLSLPPAAAQRLRYLAQQGDNSLRELGILSVQLEGDQVISVTVSNDYNEQHQVVSSHSSIESTNSISSVSNLTGELFANSGIQFRSPNVVVPQSAPIPFLPRNTPLGASLGPFPFSSMTHAAHNIQNLMNNHTSTSDSFETKGSLLVNLLQSDVNSFTVSGTRMCSQTFSTGALETQSDTMSKITSSPVFHGKAWQSSKQKNSAFTVPHYNSVSVVADKHNISNYRNSCETISQSKTGMLEIPENIKELKNISVPRCLSSNLALSPCLVDALHDISCSKSLTAYSGQSNQNCFTAQHSQSAFKEIHESAQKLHMQVNRSMGQSTSDTSHCEENLLRERQFLINPVTGELESASSVSSEENENEIEKLSPTGLTFSDSEEIRLSNGIMASHMMQQHTYDSEFNNDKLKLKLKLHSGGKNDMQSDPYSVDKVSTKSTTGVPRLRISLKGPNAAVLIEPNENNSPKNQNNNNEVNNNKEYCNIESSPLQHEGGTENKLIESLSLSVNFENNSVNYNPELKKILGISPLKRSASCDVPNRERETIKFGNMLELEEKIKKKSVNELVNYKTEDSASCGRFKSTRKERVSVKDRKRASVPKTLPENLNLIKKNLCKLPSAKKIKLPLPLEKAKLSALEDINGMSLFNNKTNLAQLNYNMTDNHSESFLALLNINKKNEKCEIQSCPESKNVNQNVNLNSHVPLQEIQVSHSSLVQPVKDDLTSQNIQSEDSGIESMDTQSEKSPNQEEKDTPDTCICKTNLCNKEGNANEVLNSSMTVAEKIMEPHHLLVNSTFATDSFIPKPTAKTNSSELIHLPIYSGTSEMKSSESLSSVNNNSLMLTSGAKVVPVKVLTVQSSQSHSYRPLSVESQSSHIVPTTMTILSSSSSPVKVFVTTVAPTTAVTSSSTSTANVLVFKSCVTSPSGEGFETTENVISLPEGLSISRIHQSPTEITPLTEAQTSFSPSSPDPQPVHRVPPKYTYSNSEKLRDPLSPFLFEDDCDSAPEEQKNGDSVACDHNYVTKIKPLQTNATTDLSNVIKNDITLNTSNVEKELIEYDKRSDFVTCFPVLNSSDWDNKINEKLKRTHNSKEIPAVGKHVKVIKRNKADSSPVSTKRCFHHGYKEAG